MNKRLIESLKENNVSLSDIESIFQDALNIKDINKQIDFIFEQLPEVDCEDIIELWDEFLDSKENKKIKSIKRAMQTGGGMVGMLPTNVSYNGTIFDPYN